MARIASAAGASSFFRLERAAVPQVVGVGRDLVAAVELLIMRPLGGAGVSVKLVEIENRDVSVPALLDLEVPAPQEIGDEFAVAALLGPSGNCAAGISIDRQALPVEVTISHDGAPPCFPIGNRLSLIAEQFSEFILETLSVLSSH